MSPRPRFPATPLGQWQKRITRRVFVDSDGLPLGELTGMLAAMWEDAQKGRGQPGTPLLPPDTRRATFGVRHDKEDGA